MEREKDVKNKSEIEKCVRGRKRKFPSGRKKRESACEYVCMGVCLSMLACVRVKEVDGRVDM